MRDRSHILGDLERSYREAFERAESRSDDDRMERLDFHFQRDQLWLEVALDLRDLLSMPEDAAQDEKSLLDKAKALRNIAKGRMP